MGRYVLWALVGWPLSPGAWLLLHRGDPPPFSKYLGVSIMGAIGGVLGGIVATYSDPMPGLAVVGAIAGAMALAGLASAVWKSLGTAP